MSRVAPVDHHGLAPRLATAALEGGSGILTATQKRLRRLFCVEDGWLVHAASNVLEEQPAEFLVRRGLLTPTERALAVEEAEREGRKVVPHLAEKNIVPPEALERAMQDHARRLLFATLDWWQGENAFERGRPAIDGEFKVRLSVPGLILDFARSHPPSVDALRVRLGPPSSRAVVVEPRRALLGSLEPGSDVAALIERCDGKLQLTELIDGSTPTAERSWRALYGLVLLGVVELDNTRQVRVPASKRGATREEVLARLERAHGVDHYGLLELTSTATRDEIREAYYFLARRYHPDRFRAGPLADMLGHIEAFFTRVTEAYNTLFDPEMRATYDQQLASTTPTIEPEKDAAYLARQNFVYAQALIERGRLADAVNSLENAIRLDASQAAYPLELGRLLAKNPRRRDDAERYLLKATEVNPTLVDAYLALGDLHVKAGKPEDAATMFREVLRWEPDHAEAKDRLRELGVKS